MKPLNNLQWVVAFQQYAIAAAAASQWAYSSSMTHMTICHQVAANAGFQRDVQGAPRRHWLGILYDEIARKSWSNQSLADASFDIDVASRAMDQNLLRLAEQRYDEIMLAKSAKRGKNWHQEDYKGFQNSSQSSGWKRSWNNGGQQAYKRAKSSS